MYESIRTTNALSQAGRWMNEVRPKPKAKIMTPLWRWHGPTCGGDSIEAVRGGGATQTQPQKSRHQVTGLNRYPQWASDKKDSNWLLASGLMSIVFLCCWWLLPRKISVEEKVWLLASEKIISYQARLLGAHFCLDTKFVVTYLVSVPTWRITETN